MIVHLSVMAWLFSSYASASKQALLHDKSTASNQKRHPQESVCLHLTFFALRVQKLHYALQPCFSLTCNLFCHSWISLAHVSFHAVIGVEIPVNVGIRGVIGVEIPVKVWLATLKWLMI
jgi:hypothetical protein